MFICVPVCECQWLVVCVSLCGFDFRFARSIVGYYYFCEVTSVTCFVPGDLLFRLPVSVAVCISYTISLFSCCCYYYLAYYYYYYMYWQQQ